MSSVLTSVSGRLGPLSDFPLREQLLKKSIADWLGGIVKICYENSS